MIRIHPHIASVQHQSEIILYGIDTVYLVVIGRIHAPHLLLKQGKVHGNTVVVQVNGSLVHKAERLAVEMLRFKSGVDITHAGLTRNKGTK